MVATDINNGGRMDLFVANDTTQNHLFINRGAGKWEELSIAGEVGFSDSGQARRGGCRWGRVGRSFCRQYQDVEVSGIVQLANA